MAESTTSTAQVNITVASPKKMGGGCCTSRRTKLRLIFIGLTLLSIIINLDGGAVPQALLYIQETFELTILQARSS